MFNLTTPYLSHYEMIAIEGVNPPLAMDQMMALLALNRVIAAPI
jgi:hypothetical protein